MEIKLDTFIEDAINKNYQIDTSVFKDIEARRQSSEGAKNSITNILETAPTKPPAPESSQSASTQLINNANYNIQLKEKQLQSILDLLSLLDTSIDKVDELVVKLDSKALTLIDEINSAMESVKVTYNERIDVGCRNGLVWNFIGTSTGYDGTASTSRTFSDYEVIDDPSQRVVLNKYGIKYYQKPSNRDYGFNIISEFTGSISVGSSNLAVISAGGTTSIQIGDTITDNLSTPQAFNIGSLPEVVGFGSTSILTTRTNIGANVNLGSNIIAHTGIGTTSSIAIGDYVTNLNVFSENTQVVGFGTTTTIIQYKDVGLSTITSISLVVPSVILNKVSISSATSATIGFGSYISYSSLLLSGQSNITSFNNTFTAIRQTSDITENFNYTNSPIDPVTIGILDSQRVGIGHKTEIVNNGFSPGPSQWRQVLSDPEPRVGPGTVTYYTGNIQWPYDLLYGYATKGQIYRFNTNTPPTYSLISPTGNDPTGTLCNTYSSNITVAESRLQSIINNNIPEIQKILSAASNIRKSRDTDEMQAWAYIQSASYIRMEMNDLKSDIDTLSSIDYDSL